MRALYLALVPASLLGVLVICGGSYALDAIRAVRSWRADRPPRPSTTQEER